MALTADGLNLAGVRLVLELQEQTRQLQAEIDRLNAVAHALPGQKQNPGTSAQPG